MRGRSPTAATYTAFSERIGFWIFRERPNERLKRRLGAYPSEPVAFTSAHPQTPLIQIATYHVTTLKISLLKDLDAYTKIRT
jgi:hypothetical protein